MCKTRGIRAARYKEWTHEDLLRNYKDRSGQKNQEHNWPHHVLELLIYAFQDEYDTDLLQVQKHASQKTDKRHAKNFNVKR